MKKVLFTVLIALFAIPAAAQLCTEIPVDCDTPGVMCERDIRLATYKVMSDVLNEADTTACHDQRLLLAQAIANSPGQWWRVIVEYQQAQQTGCTVGWASLTWTQLVTQLGQAWTEVAQLRYGDCTQAP